MTKLDEIQERITQMAGDTAYLPLPQEFFDVLSDITRELQRIDADVKRQLVMPPSPDSANLEW